MRSKDFNEWNLNEETESKSDSTKMRENIQQADEFRCVKARLIFLAQTKRFECFYNFLIVLYIISTTVSLMLTLVITSGGVVGCSP